jgi:hypothetical protein
MTDTEILDYIARNPRKFGFIPSHEFRTFGGSKLPDDLKLYSAYFDIRQHVKKIAQGETE